jgi:hypothetical protein
METRHPEPVEGAARERARQRRAAAHPPRPMRGFARGPSQLPAHPTPASFPVLTPTPRLPEVAAPPTAGPGVQLLEARRRCRKANVGVPPVEVPPQSAHDAPQ